MYTSTRTAKEEGNKNRGEKELNQTGTFTQIAHTGDRVFMALELALAVVAAELVHCVL